MGNKCCTNCFSEIEIINFIDSEKIIGDCDYCNSNNVNFCDVVDVGNFIMEGIESYDLVKCTCEKELCNLKIHIWRCQACIANINA